MWIVGSEPSKGKRRKEANLWSFTRTRPPCEVLLRNCFMFHWRNEQLRHWSIRHLPLLALLLWILAIVWFMLCFCLSSQTGEETGQLSTAMARKVSEMLGLSEDSIPVLNRGLRTFAHFVCYFILTVLICGAFAATFTTYTHSFLWPLLPCVVLGFLDELRKVYIPGRHCSIPEACLNALGCVFGCITVWALQRVLHRKE